MATVTFKSTPVHTAGELPKVGTKAPKFELVKGDLSTLKNDDLTGKRIVLNIFPSLDTSVCATSVRKFNQLAAQMDNTVVLAVSKDLPFAQGRFCTTEGIDNVIPVSAFRSAEFGKDYGVELIDGLLQDFFPALLSFSTNRVKSFMKNLFPKLHMNPTTMQLSKH